MARRDLTRGVVPLDSNWVVQPPVAARRGTGAVTADVPEFLLTSDALVPVGGAVARESAVRRAAVDVAPTPLRLGVPAGADEPLVAVARRESGALTFHLPARREPQRGLGGRPRGRPHGNGRRSAGAPAERELVVFEIPPVPTDALLPRESGGLGRRGLVSKIVKVVVFKAAEFVARPVLRLLAERLERRLWTGAGRSEGWFRVTRDALAGAGRLLPDTPNLPPGQRGLLLIHGTFSHAASAFRGLAGDPEFFDTIAGLYGDRVYAFNHYTISKSPAENVADLLDALPAGRRQTFDVITHSRGGLVLRTLARDGASTVSLGRVVLVASPNQGTPLATPQRWEDTVGWFANLLELFPENPFTTAGEWVAESLSWLARQVVGAGGLPGLNSMDGNGDVVAALRDVSLAADSTYALAANYEPAGALLARVADMGIDGFFDAANDLVVPTAGGWDLGGVGDDGNIPPTQVGCFGPGGNLAPGQSSAVHHVNFFSNRDARQFIARALSGAPVGVPPVAGFGALPRRRAIDQLSGAAAGVAEPPGAGVPATFPAGAGEVPAAPVAERVDTGDGRYDDWDREETLHLIVLPAARREAPPGDSEGQKRSRKRSAVRKEPRPDAQLLAIYGSARVLTDFHLSGDRLKEAGERWRQIFAFQSRINDYVEGATGVPAREEIEQFGCRLFDTLLQGDVRRLYDQARGRHAARRIKIVFTSMIPWVADLPWEFAFDQNCKSFLATSDVRLVRNVLTSVPPDDIRLREGPLRILVISAQPGGTQQLSIEEERAVILRSFQPLVDAGAVRVDVLPRAGPREMHGWVQSGRYDVLHFIGHGEFDKAANTGYLIFEDQQRRPLRVSTSCVKDILRSREIKLVFLNACETGRGGRADYNQGVAPGLVADGVPAVVANQYSVLDRSATTFAQHFYWCLAQGLSLGEAVRESRIALNYSGGEVIDWAVPVLFARNPDAVLCREVIRRDVPKALPRTSLGDRRSTERHRRRVSVWDVADDFPELRGTLDRMNTAQTEFGFRLVNLTAPYGTWQVQKSGEKIAYLFAERVAERMRGTIRSLDSDVLFCVTDLPLRDETTLNIYMWWGDMEKDPIVIFSTWGFDPPLRGPRLAKAVANMSVAGLAALLAASESHEGPKGSISYYNKERDAGHLVGDLSIDPKTRRALAKKVSPEAVDAFEALLRVFPPAGETSDTRESRRERPKPRAKPKRRGKRKRAPSSRNRKTKA